MPLPNIGHGDRGYQLKLACFGGGVTFLVACADPRTEDEELARTAILETAELTLAGFE
jgi:hypothetical protein